MTLSSEPRWVIWLILSFAQIGLIALVAGLSEFIGWAIERLDSARGVERAFPARDRVNG